MRSLAAEAQPLLLPSFVAVHGSEGGFDIAEEVLTGCKYECRLNPSTAGCAACATAVLHLPSGWAPEHRHLDNQLVSIYHRYYWDETVVDAALPPVRGRDVTPPEGLDRARVVFYVGEGEHPESISAYRAGQVPLNRFSLGDHGVRYLLMLSCNVLAHGPEVQQPPLPDDHIKPGSFDPETDTGDPKDGLNVFRRWGEASATTGLRPLNTNLRLACGGSSRIGASQNRPTHAFWHYYSKVGLGPAESFLLGFHGFNASHIPLCISYGGSSSTSSGLFDPRFEDQPLAERDRIYIEYPEVVDANDPLVVAAIKSGLKLTSSGSLAASGDPPILPVLKVVPAPTAEFVKELDFAGSLLKYGFRGGSAERTEADVGFLADAAPASVPVRRQDLCVKRQEDSGAVTVVWRPAAPAPVPEADHGKERERLGTDALQRLLARVAASPLPAVAHGAPLLVPTAVAAVRMKVDSVPAASVGALTRKQIVHEDDKCTYVQVNSVYEVGGQAIPILGEGGEILAAMCPARPPQPADQEQAAIDPCQRTVTSQLAFVYGGRVAIGTRQAAQKTPAEALDEARLQLQLQGLADRYDPNSYTRRWGYKAAPSHCHQDEMFLVYQFDFQSTGYAALSPLTIEVPAHDLGEGHATVDDTYTCAPESAEGG